MIAFKKLGKVCVPSGAKSFILKNVDKEFMRRRISQAGVHQEDPEDEAYIHSLNSQINQFIDFEKCNEKQILLFRNVSSHNDGWNPVYREGKKLKPLFFHVVVSGGGTLTVGTQRFKVDRGDVFAMNPNMDHAFEHDKGEYCISYSMSGCSRDIRFVREEKEVTQKRHNIKNT